MVFLAKVLHRLEIAERLALPTPPVHKPTQSQAKRRRNTLDKAKAFERCAGLVEVTSEGEEEGEGGGEMDGAEKGEEEGEGEEREEGEGEERKEGEGEEREGQKELGKIRDLKWLTRRMCWLANYEAGHYPKETIKVCCERLGWI